MFENFRHCIYVFFISMLPVVELRGAIPVGAAFGIHPLLNALICIVGNMLPVPAILWLFPIVLRWMKKIPYLQKAAFWLEDHVMRKTEKVSRGAAIGLFVFVAIPLPGTGAWTGSMIAALLNIRKKYAFIAIFAGVLAASCIMIGISYGVLEFLKFLL